MATLLGKKSNSNASPEDKIKVFVGDSYEGGFDELRFYSRALNQAEIDALAGLSSSSVIEFPSPKISFYIQNPSSENLNVMFEKSVSLKQINIYQLNGKEVLSCDLTNETATTHFTLSLGTIAEGLYFMTMRDNKNAIYKSRLVIAR